MGIIDVIGVFKKPFEGLKENKWTSYWVVGFWDFVEDSKFVFKVEGGVEKWHDMNTDVHSVGV